MNHCNNAFMKPVVAIGMEGSYGRLVSSTLNINIDSLTESERNRVNNFKNTLDLIKKEDFTKLAFDDYIDVITDVCNNVLIPYFRGWKSVNKTLFCLHDNPEWSKGERLFWNTLKNDIEGLY